jgi:hypothetical protein
MQPLASPGPDLEPTVVLPPARQRPSQALARLSGALALRAARRTLSGLARGEPGPVLAFGFSAGLLAQAALRGAAALRHLQLCQASPGSTSLARGKSEPELLAVQIETLVVRTTRIWRRP